MNRHLHIRLDAETARRLEIIAEAYGGNKSAAVKRLINDSAAYQEVRRVSVKSGEVVVHRKDEKVIFVDDSPPSLVGLTESLNTLKAQVESAIAQANDLAGMTAVIVKNE